MPESPQHPSARSSAIGLGAIHSRGKDVTGSQEGRREKRWAGPTHALRQGVSGRVGQVASAVAGGTLLTMGLGRRSLGGAALALAGGGLLYRSLRGQDRPSRISGRPRTEARASMEGLQRSITIQKPAHELYRAWREAGNLSRVMGHFADVTEAGPDRQHWKVQGPRGRTLEWDSHIVEEHPGELLRWESVEGAQLPNEGWVRFLAAPGDWGTVVTLRLRFEPPAGALGRAALKLLGNVPSVLAMKALKRFKSLVETGEIPATRPNPAARESGYSS